MPVADAEVHQSLINLDLVTTLKSSAEPFEEAYHWLKEKHKHLNPCEMVGTVVFASKGIQKIHHLSWCELSEFHRSYERLDEIEKALQARATLRDTD